MARARASPVKRVTRCSSILAWLAALAVVLVALWMPAHGQSQELSTLPGQWVTFGRGDGLPDDEVFAVWGTPDGTLWAGTAAGPARFDGVAWQDFEGDAQAPAGAVRAVWGRSAQDVWAAGDAGLAHFDGRSWQQIPVETLALPDGPLYAIWGNEGDELWVGGQGGTAHFDGAEWRAFTPQNSELPDGPVRALAGSADGRVVWFGTDAGLARYEPRNDTWLRFAPENSDLTTLPVLSLWLTDETLWAGTWSGLLRYDLTTGQWTLMDGSQWDGPDNVTSIWSIDGELWLAVSAPDVMLADEFQVLKRRSPGGLRRFDGHRWQRYGEAEGLASDTVNAIWSDGQGILWFATRSGLSRFDSQRWRAYPSISLIGQRVDVVRGDAAGDVWFGGQDALYTWQGERWIRDLPPDWSQPLVRALWAGGSDDVWIGSWESGAAHWDGLRWERFTREYGLASDTVNAIWSDSPGSIWFGTSEGLSHLARVSGQWETLTVANSDLPGDWVSALWGDGQTLWVGTPGGSAARYEPAQGRWETFQPVGLVDNDVQALALDEAGGIWVVTRGGVAHHDRASGSWQQWPAADILPRFDEPRALAVAPDGTVWLSGATLGVYRYTPEEGNWQLVAPDWLDSTVDRIWVSPDGTLWFATLGGAMRYDPQSGDWLKLTARDGLASDDVRAVWGDGTGTLWFATRAGVSRLAEGHWQTFTGDDGLAGTNTLLLTGDDSGNVWAAGLNGVSRYADGAWEEVLSWPMPPGLWRDLYAPGRGRLRVVAPDGTLHYFDGRDWEVVTVADGQLAGLLQAVVEGPQGELWVGSRQGLAQRPAAGASWSRITTAGLIDNDVNAIWGDGERYVWFATSHGVSRYEVTTGTWRSFTTADGLLSDNVTDLWGDGKGRVWAAQDGGVSLFDGQRWSALPVEGLPSRRVNSVWGDGTGTVWVATMAGPAWWDGARWQLPPAGPGVSGEVHALWAAADGLWVAAEGSVNRFDGERWRTFTAADDGLPPGQLRAIWSDGQGEAWVGGSGGLAYFDGNQWQPLPPETVPGEVNDIWGRDANDVWVATDKGVAHFDGVQWQRVLANEEAIAVTGDGKGGLWLGTSQGLRHYDGQMWREVTDQHLLSAAVMDIWQVPGGTTWVATSQGVYGFGGPEKPLILKGGAVRALLVDRAGTLWFAESDGEVQRVDQLPPLRIFGGDVRAIAEDTSGDIWFGTGEGLLRYRPRPPAASIQSVDLASGQPAQMAGRQIKLPYSPGTVTITLVATDTASLGPDLMFWYRLDPQEKVWKRWDSFPFVPPADKRRQISYDGLQPGKNYTFYFAAYNATNDTMGRQAWTIAVSQAPPWERVRKHWAFPWALGAGGLLLLVAGGGGLRWWQTRRAYGYHDLQVTVTPADTHDIHRVRLQLERVSRFPQLQRKRTVRLPAYDCSFDSLIIQDTLNHVRMDQTNELLLRDFGISLYQALFTSEVTTHLVQYLKLGSQGIRLRLRFAGVLELATLPWEFLHGGDDLGFLTVESDVALVRDLSPEEAEETPRTRPPLKVLVAWTTPQDLPRLDVAEEVAAIGRAFAGLVGKKRAVVQVLEHARPETFIQAMQEGYDLIHFVGHGGVEDGIGVLYFEDEDGDAVSMAQGELIALLAEAPTFTDKTLKLAVLNACRTAEPGDIAGLAGLAAALVTEGRLPAVVGMGYPITSESAAVFSRAFYETLVRHGQVDHAVAKGREALFAEVGAGQRDWGVPRLYMRNPEGIIFEVT